MQLAFDFDRVAVMPVILPTDARKRLPAVPKTRKPSANRQARGRTAYQSGLLAEGAVADRYTQAGYDLLATRWRGKAGEVDLILRKDGIHVFVEVKAARDFDRAALRLNRRQMDRICLAACEYCGSLPTGQLTAMRLDAALVDQFGRVQIIENAFCAD
ncbi:YraN family protein [Paracoccus jeotgali]|nr:YraN family protein [Paracoccus jeotgali]